MQKNDKGPSKSDIYTLYDFYKQYKFYYDYYWENSKYKVKTKEDIKNRMSEIFNDREKLGGPIEALCFYANIPKEKLFNKDGSPKDINELDVLKMIVEANYGETND